MKISISAKIVAIISAFFFIQCGSPDNKDKEPLLTDSTSPLHLLQPEYNTPYSVPQKAQIIEVLDRVYTYLNATTPAGLVDRVTNRKIEDYQEIDKNTIFEKGDFRLLSYEWGITYAAMLYATDVTGDKKYAEYTKERLNFLADIYPYFSKLSYEPNAPKHAMYTVLHPHALDDAGSVCAAMIKTKERGSEADLDPMINNFMDYISNGQFRLEDGTLARNRPMANSIWLDDLFMSVPALAQMAKHSNNKEYFDDAVQQVLQFSDRMFNPEKGLYMHGWVQEMEDHPEFHWARANGWAVLTMVELLDVLPTEYEGRDEILKLLKAHIKGLASYQSSEGFWHQLIDRNDSYLETSATAIYVYSIARAINQGYVDAKVYGPVVSLAWNAVASKVTDQGQVEGTCVGTGMAFDPAFYYYRPVNVYAAHSYGPLLLAGTEMIVLLKNSFPKMNDNALMFFPEFIETDEPIFEVNNLKLNFDF